ncbi:hypothetical protein H7F50_13150 [Novosphingobium flavum]|jgi:hypothetical protein|uniref:Uncharacterized protein n=1 Tax=Novosphingobium aerophilum TaxID=2839843 RepID=A0A7X1F8Q0_9SPHN|nr:MULTISPECIES: hypothetical protein [Novosphingobium]MBC2652442.1 hypothetical protein [Novosphingobium aerophilum]MBC2662701.1 hypothetical protein [Novosphingobium aerophilum]
MGLFQADLIRSFAVGFVLGAIGLFVAMGSGAEDMGNAMVPHAVAAPAQPDQP